MGLDFYNCDLIKSARKEHKCDYCCKPIHKGDTYYSESGKYCGDFFQRKMHIFCMKIFEDYCSNVGDEEFDWEEVDEFVREYFCVRTDCPHNYMLESTDENWTECPYERFADCPKIQEIYKTKGTIFV